MLELILAEENGGRRPWGAQPPADISRTRPTPWSQRKAWKRVWNDCQARGAAPLLLVSSAREREAAPQNLIKV